MLSRDELANYASQAAEERRLAAQATDPAIAALHAELAARYSALAMSQADGKRRS